MRNEWLSVKKEINNKQAYIQSLQEITLKDLQEFYHNILLQDKNRQEILVQVQGEKFRNSSLLTVKDEVIVTDVDLLPK